VVLRTHECTFLFSGKSVFTPSLSRHDSLGLLSTIFNVLVASFFGGSRVEEAFGTGLDSGVVEA